MNNPLIGLGLRIPSEKGHQMNSNYPLAVQRAGGTPLVIPVCCRDFIEVYARMLDGLVLTGGGDADPALYGESPIPQAPEFDRAVDEAEIEICRAMIALGKPVMGICRGMQMINVALGGSLWQDLPAQRPGAVCHKNAEKDSPAATHTVYVEADSGLFARVGQREMITNSIHHQAVKELAPGLACCARTADGLVEAFESGDQKVLGFQWHPEAMHGCRESDEIFKWFVGMCEKR